MQASIAEVILDQAIDKPLDYEIPKHLIPLEIGMRVEVPLKEKMAKGIIFAIKEKSAFHKIKPLNKVLGEKPFISKELFQLAIWVSKYYCCPISKVLKSILPPPLRKENMGHKIQNFIKPTVSLEILRKSCENLRSTHPSQAKVLDLLLQTPKGLLLSEILEKTNVSESPVKTLCKKKLLQELSVQIDRSLFFDHDFFPTKPKLLNHEQEKILQTILHTYGHFQTHLIHGVTGSGKTEIYLQAIQHVLNQNKSILYLIPEIALTAQTIERFKGRFGKEQIAILHHRLSPGEKYDTWLKIQSGDAKIVIGARSAVFSPISSLGMIIVDEEHESSYKQSDETPKYHCRDVAIFRAKLSECPILLGSATPSLESYSNAMNGKYHLHTLTNRADNAHLPKVQIIDLKKEFEKAKGFVLFSDPLIQAIKQRIEKGEQTLLFLNRRGYHTSAQCPSCLETMDCPHCSLALTYHIGEKILACHLCDFRQTTPKSCPKCQAEGPLKFKGAGTELVEKALHALFPAIRTLRLDADTTKHKGSHDRIFKQFRSGKADILIGTQMIAKGHHFPLVTLVGVIGIDGSLNIPDFRASETVFQLLTQVAGRAGRGELPGEVFFQTHLPKHPTILNAASQDFLAFYHEEMLVRELFGFPPYVHLIKCSFSSPFLEKCKQKANIFHKQLIVNLPPDAEILPVIPCGYAKIQNRYRFQCLIKVKKIPSVLGTLEKLRKNFRSKENFRFSIDVDPLTTYF